MTAPNRSRPASRPWVVVVHDTATTLRPADPVAAALTTSAMAASFSNGVFYTVSALFFTRVVGQVGLGLTVAGAVAIAASDRAGPGGRRGRVAGAAAAIGQRLKRILADELRGLETREYAREARREAAAMIAQIDEQLHANVGSDPLAPLVNAPDPVKVWRDAPLADKRVVIDRLMTVTILRTQRKGRGFDPATLHIEPKHALGTLTAA